MRLISFIVYNIIVIPLFAVSVRIASLFDEKIRIGLQGRRNLFRNLKSQIQKLPPTAPRIWIHIASMGEFEQAKPIVLRLKNSYPNTRIILSFFSPSGYNNATSFKQADVVTYIPLDTLRNAKKFIDTIRPDIALVIRHDIWPNMQRYLRQAGIPSVLVDASVSDKRLKVFKNFKFFFRLLFSSFTEVLAVSEIHAQRIEKVYPDSSHIHIIGDTRYDQVVNRCNERDKIAFLQNSGLFDRVHCFVVGSTWPSDEKVVLPAVETYLAKDKDLRIIVAPHEPTEQHLNNIEDFFQRCNMPVLRLAHWDDSREKEFRVLLIDRVGMLANLYALGALAFVGGGFGPGVHSVLEPAAHGCAVLFGPRNTNSVEAQSLIKEGGGAQIGVSEHVERYLEQLLSSPESIERMGARAKKFVDEKTGASSKVVDIIKKYVNLEE